MAKKKPQDTVLTTVPDDTMPATLPAPIPATLPAPIPADASEALDPPKPTTLHEQTTARVDRLDAAMARAANTVAWLPPAACEKPNGVAVGRIVHYALKHPGGAIEVRPAIIVRVGQDDRVNLQVFLDGVNDATVQAFNSPTLWRASVVYDATGVKASTWRFPPRV
jgi:hypothetical protein